jgi:hypothetical protein
MKQFAKPTFIISPQSTASLLMLIMLGLGVGYCHADVTAQGVVLRCGWLDNPSPGNAWLNDRDGEWTVAIQGGHQAKGKWTPTFKNSQWVRMGVGSYGYGCVCMKVKANAESQEIIEVISAIAKPLSACRQDKALKEPENQLK